MDFNRLVYREELEKIDKQLAIKAVSDNKRRPPYISEEQYLLNSTRSCTSSRKYKTGQIVHNSLKLSDIKIPEYCPVFGTPLDRRDRNHVPTVDRIDNSKGYESNNIYVISHKANRLKSNGTIDDFEKILVYMKKHLTWC